MNYRTEEMVFVSHRILQKVTSVNYTSCARVEIEDLQPCARNYDAISHSGRHILRCNILFENLQPVCAWKVKICLKAEHQRQPHRRGGKKKKKVLSLSENLLFLKIPKTNRSFFSYPTSEMPAYHRVGKQLSPWRS